MTNLKLKEQVGDAADPCDPERLRVLEDAMREAIDAYLLYIDPHNQVSRADFVDHLVGILDRRDVADAAGHVDPDPGLENEFSRTHREVS